MRRLIERNTLQRVALENDAVYGRSLKLSGAHSERLGIRALDLIHVAAALVLESELFLTMDVRQAELAKAEGLKLGPAI